MNLQQTSFSGHINTITATTNSNSIIVLSRPDNRQSKTDVTIHALDTSLNRTWQKTKQSYADRPIKIANDNIWFNSGYVLEQSKLNGETIATVKPKLTENEWMADYLIHDDLIYISTVKRFAKAIQQKFPTILCVNMSGDTIWATQLPINIGGIRVGKWTPDYFYQALMLSGNRLLVTYRTESTGIGISYCLNTSDGKLLWHTEPKYTGYRIALTGGSFLIGTGGNQITRQYSHDGDIEVEWQTHGQIVVSQDGTLRIIESSNRLPSQMHVAILEPDGSVLRGSHLDNYYTSYPILDMDDNMWFWRSGAIYRVDSHLKKHKVCLTPLREHALTTRMLLVSGILLFSAGNNIWGLNIGGADIAESRWVCGGGNLGANPVF